MICLLRCVYKCIIWIILVIGIVKWLGMKFGLRIDFLFSMVNLVEKFMIKNIIGFSREFIIVLLNFILLKCFLYIFVYIYFVEKLCIKLLDWKIKLFFFRSIFKW